MSPYLFVLSQEILSRLLDREFMDGRLRGVKASLAGPTLTHIMYANDIVLFTRANQRDASTLNSCLEKYCEWSGQQINRAKSGLKPTMRFV